MSSAAVMIGALNKTLLFLTIRSDGEMYMSVISQNEANEIK